MYNFIYIIFYKLSERSKMSDPNDYAATIVTVTIGSQIFSILSFINYITGCNLLVKVFGTNMSKYSWLPGILLLMFVVQRFYKKNGNKVADRYKEKNIIKPVNIFLVSCIIVIPFLSAIFFLNNG